MKTRSEFVREAILAVVAEKRFDTVPRTSRRTEELLRQYDFAKPYVDAENREAVVNHVESISADVPWFVAWKAIYRKPADAPVMDEDIANIASDDSLVGWTATNFARRGKLLDAQQTTVRAIYTARNSDDGRSIRWRAVHVLGRWPSEENICVLVKALTSDSYHWVRYGAARSLVEIAVRSGKYRQSAIDGLRRFVSDSEAGGWARHLILEEIVETSFMRDTTVFWNRDSQAFLDEVVSAEKNPERRSKLLLFPARALIHLQT